MPANIPLTASMTIGFNVSRDSVHHDRRYGAVVATIDMGTSWNFFSATSASTSTDEMCGQFKSNVVEAIQYFKEMRGRLPARIFIYRTCMKDDDNCEDVHALEIKEINESLRTVYESHAKAVKLAVIAVHQPSHTRFFTDGNNAPPGCIVEDDITCPERYFLLFFLYKERNGFK